jgi:hypothetical protein
MHGLNKILKKLITAGTGRSRFIFSIVGLSIAVLLMLTAVQLQSNYHDLLTAKSNQDSIANFLVLNKSLTDQTMGATSLSDAEIKDLANQPFTNAVGLLSPSRFKASIQSYSERFPFYTDIAFESVPDAFIDVNSKDWKWDESAPFVPIIAPNMFLDFYNFQFSFSQNLPQLTHEVVKMIVFKINLYGPNGNVTMQGKVVGFSDRITSLLVPENFMRWGNAHFSKGESIKPSRVIIKTTDPGNPALLKYLQSKQLVTDAEKTRFSRYRQIVDTVVGIAGFSGFVMLVFALLIFTLFIQLTIASSKEEIALLLQLGASPKQMSRFLIRQFFPVNLWIILAALCSVMILQYLAMGFLLKQHIYIAAFPSMATFLAACLILLVIWLVNRFTIKSYLRKSN